MKRFLIILIFSFLTTILFAHGTGYELLAPEFITIKTFYDTGLPMKSATVKVFTPDDYKKPVYELKTDEQGLFSFKPDKTGLWVFQILDQSGHGQRINLEVTPEMTAHSKNQSSLTLTQRILMGLAVLWGFIGTALYFKRKRGP